MDAGDEAQACIMVTANAKQAVACVIRKTVEDICKLQSGTMLPKRDNITSSYYHSFFYCNAPEAKLQLGYHYLLGVHPTGEWALMFNVFKSC
jgi:hypothetical protein